MVGNRHGTFVVVSQSSHTDSSNHKYWLIKCDACGLERHVRGHILKRQEIYCQKCATKDLGHNGKEKQCSQCRKTKDTSQFHIRQKNPLRLRHQCRDCWNEHMRLLNEARRQGTAPPKKEYRKRSLDPTPNRLPAEAFRKWLQPIYDERFETYSDLADYCGVNDSVISRILTGKQKSVYLDTVDKCLVAFNCTIFLRDMYPSLYDFTEEQEQEAIRLLYEADYDG